MKEGRVREDLDLEDRDLRLWSSVHCTRTDGPTCDLPPVLSPVT